MLLGQTVTGRAADSTYTLRPRMVESCPPPYPPYLDAGCRVRIAVSITSEDRRHNTNRVSASIAQTGLSAGWPDTCSSRRCRCESIREHLMFGTERDMQAATTPSGMGRMRCGKHSVMVLGIVPGGTHTHSTLSLSSMKASARGKKQRHKTIRFFFLLPHLHSALSCTVADPRIRDAILQGYGQRKELHRSTHRGSQSIIYQTYIIHKSYAPTLLPQPLSPPNQVTRGAPAGRFSRR